MARIVTVCTERPLALVNMAHIRWYKIAEGLARLGHTVDIAANEESRRRWPWRPATTRLAPNLGRVPLGRVKWSRYDVVKVTYQEGFEILEKHRGARHDFIISRLSTVVGPEDAAGSYFEGPLRRRMYEAQQRIRQVSRYLAVSNEPARALWVQLHGAAPPVVLVPGAVDRDIPEPADDPYPAGGGGRCLFAGNFSWKNYAPRANATLSEKLNRLGELLARHEIRLYTVGPGDTDLLDSRYVTHLGVVPYERSWSYLQFAHVGIDLVKGQGFLHNTESSKLYHYLRAGLPAVVEAGLPNADLVEAAGLGYVVPSDDLALFAQKVADAAAERWDRRRAVDYILEHHTWDSRALVYHRLLTGVPGR